jgi:peptide/nickel transport system substrate-binding protein
VFEVIDETTVRFTWDAPNPLFAPELAKSRPPFIYRPAHYLKQFHAKYGDMDEIAELAAARKLRNWASLFNKMDDMYDARNPDLPSLQPWLRVKDDGERRFVLERNPFYHRVDTAGNQLPYIDRVIMTVADGKIIPAKAQAGESDLQARNIGFSDITILKQGEKSGKFKTYLWPISKGSEDFDPAEPDGRRPGLAQGPARYPLPACPVARDRSRHDQQGALPRFRKARKRHGPVQEPAVQAALSRGLCLLRP